VTLKVVVPGKTGRMGRMVLDAVAEAPGVELAAALGRIDDVEGALAAADVYIDFTAPDATAKLADVAARRGVAGVVGTTGLGAESRAALLKAAAKIPIVLAPNFSIGVNLVAEMCEKAAALLGEEFDLEVVEVHHKAKRDAPSGTALALAEALARGRGRALDELKRTTRDGDVGARPPGEIGILAVRGGDVIGDHHVHFLGPAERIELVHRAGSRALFARGAVRAARWVVGKAPGIYSMRDVLSTTP
jgi:4-hydroxy-tetrahydrodipicolinate reductase